MGYWGTVHKRARREVLGVLKLEQPAQAAWTLALTIGPAVLTWLASHDVAAWLRTLATTGTMALAGAALYGVKMLTIPAALATEAAAETTKLRATLETYRPVRAEDPLEFAIGYLLTGTWTDKFPSGQVARVSAAAEALRERAHLGLVAIWGQISDMSLSKLVPPEFWEHHGIDLKEFFNPDYPVRTDKCVNERPTYRYNHLKVVRAQIEREWPNPV